MVKPPSYWDYLVKRKAEIENILLRGGAVSSGEVRGLKKELAKIAKELKIKEPTDG